MSTAHNTTATLTVTKQANGAHRWIAISSSAYRDRDGEIVSTKALEDDCARADATGEYGPLRWWHVKGLDIGTCDYNAMHGRMLVESGTFNDPRIAEAIKAHAGELAVSIGFNHNATEPDSDGVFHSIKRFERSFLPRDKASNLFTAIGAVRKESDMTQEKTEALNQLVGDPAVVSDLITNADTTQKSADDGNVAFKETSPDATEKQFPPKKSPAKVVADAEDAADGGDDETTEGETPADMPAADMPPKRKKKEAAPKVATIGDMPVEAFAELLGVGLKAAFEQAETNKAVRTDPAVAQEIETLKARLAELEGDTPKFARGRSVTQESDPEAVMKAALEASGVTKEQAPSNPMWDLFFTKK